MSREPEKELAEALALTAEAIQCTDETHYRKGEELLRRAVALAPEHPVVIENYVNFCLQVAHNNLCTFGKYHEAVRYFEKALQYRSDDAEAWMDLGTAHAMSDELLETLQAWQKAFSLLSDEKVKDRGNIERLLENIRLVERALKKRSRRRSSTEE